MELVGWSVGEIGDLYMGFTGGGGTLADFEFFALRKIAKDDIVHPDFWSIFLSGRQGICNVKCIYLQRKIFLQVLLAAENSRRICRNLFARQIFPRRRKVLSGGVDLCVFFCRKGIARHKTRFLPIFLRYAPIIWKCIFVDIYTIYDVALRMKCVRYFRRFPPFPSSQIPNAISPTPIKKGHFGKRAASNIPMPTEMRITPTSHCIGAPLHLLRIALTPFFYPMRQGRKMCMQCPTA